MASDSETDAAVTQPETDETEAVTTPTKKGHVHDKNATPKKSAMKKPIEPMTWTQIWQSLIVVGIVFSMAGTGVYMVINPDSIKWLEPYLMDGLIQTAGPASANVIALTDNTFDQVRASEGFLVEFYAPWCGHCKKLAPDFAATADALVGEAQLGAVDCIANPEVATEFGIKSFPTLMWFSKNVSQHYTGGTTQQLLQFWIRKRTRGPTVAVKTKADITEMKALHPTLVIGFLEEGSVNLPEFSTTAMADDKRPYVLSSDTELALSFCDAVPCAVLLTDFRPTPVVWDWSGEAQTLVNFVGVEQFPPVFTFTKELAQVILTSAYLSTTVYLFGGSDDLVASFETLAMQHRQSAIFVAVPEEIPEPAGMFTSAKPSMQKRLQEYLGAGDVDSPCLTVVDKSSTGRMRKFPLEERINSADQVETHLDRFFKGELVQKLKSDEAPLTQTAPVVTIVGSNFGDYVGRDTCLFLEIYAPWCGHCKKLTPIWASLATKYNTNKALVIAKMDGTTNEIAPISAKGYPSLIFFKSNSVTPIEYKGGRNLKEMSEFVEEQTSVEVESTTPTTKDEL